MSNSPIRILHFDDDPLFLEQLKQALEGNSDRFPFQVTSTDDYQEYRAALCSDHGFQVIILDIRINGQDIGWQLAGETRKLVGSTPIIMCSDHTEIDLVAACLNHGANDFIFKSSDVREMALRVYGAFRLTKVAVRKEGESSDILTIGESMRHIQRRLPNIIGSAISSVHIIGESGTGKEAVSELFERHLPASTPFSRVHCGAIAPSLMESELFGHVKGAFTGAIADKPGLIEVANGGWLFLDEVATLPPTTQIALLRVLENGMLRRVGSPKEKQVTIRVLSATNESIPDLIAKGLFRQDLWQRLCEATVELPPLRERMHEFDELVDHFCETMRGGPYHIAPDAREILRQHQWKEGNIRELRNCLRAMTELHFERMLTPLSIPKRFWRAQDQRSDVHELTEACPPPAGEDVRSLSLTWSAPTRPSFDQLSHQLLIMLLRQDFRKHGKMSLRMISGLTGIPRSTLAARLKVLAESEMIEKHEFNQMVNLTVG